MKRTLILLTLVCSIAASVWSEATRITLATTTSTENSGLLAVLLPPFEAKTGIRVDVVAVGTGAAIRLGQNGDADIILVHAPAAEAAFVEAGYGVNRRAVMHNDFVILGPSSDPAGVSGARSATEAYRRLSAATSRSVSFVSRGDDSGTHKKERAIWAAAAIEPSGGWYKEVGQGMGAVLTLASEMGGYTLADRGTFLAMRSKIALVVHLEGDPVLFNPYSIIAVNPAVHAHSRYEDAMRLIAWVTSQEGQAIIGGFRLQGEELFHPDAIP
jgi:tungstate transport system substrate-binding protein